MAKTQTGQAAAPAVLVLRTFALNGPAAYEFFTGKEGVRD